MDFTTKIKQYRRLCNRANKLGNELIAQLGTSDDLALDAALLVLRAKRMEQELTRRNDHSVSPNKLATYGR